MVNIMIIGPIIKYRIYTTSSMGSGVQADLGTDTSAKISAGVQLVSTAASAVVASGSNQSLTVDGSAIGDKSGVIFSSNGVSPMSHNSVTIDDGGYVAGGSFGVFMEGQSTVDNAGQIKSDYIGLAASSLKGGDATIVNNSGVISGDIGVSLLGAGDFTIKNSGSINGGLFDEGTGTLTFVNTGTIIGQSKLGAGADKYSGAKGQMTDNDQRAYVDGGKGNDRLIGGKHDDGLAGGEGADVLTGHGGADRFIFFSANESKVAAGSRDTITDFSSSQHDQIQFRFIPASSDYDAGYHFIGTKAFNGHGGAVRYASGHGETHVLVDLDGDRHADMRIDLDGVMELHKSDFLF